MRLLALQAVKKMNDYLINRHFDIYRQGAGFWCRGGPGAVMIDLLDLLEWAPFDKTVEFKVDWRRSFNDQISDSRWRHEQS